METPNLRTWKVGQDKAKDVSSTRQLSGNAKETGKLNQSNSTTEYSVAAPKFDNLGGENKHR